MVAVRTDFTRILRDNLPVLDVRAPGEFERGALPRAVNMPILTDAERAEVGIVYKQHGNEAAMKRGFKLVVGTTKKRRVQAWLAYAEAHKETLLTCWRGGQRSAIAQRWLEEAGCQVPRLAGGFKAMRQFSLNVLKQAHRRNWLVIAGPTGVGKTQLLNRFPHAIDLEALANHRGSSFGRRETPQPVPVSFELALAQKLLQTTHFRTCLIEDESRTIGRLAVPSELYNAIQTAPILVLEATAEERIRHTYDLYVRGKEPQSLRDALVRIQKRLGNERYKIVKKQLDRATGANCEALHLEWIANVFRWYYDPMYAYQLALKRDRIVFRGSAIDAFKFLTNYREATAAYP